MYLSIKLLDRVVYNTVVGLCYTMMIRRKYGNSRIEMERRNKVITILSTYQYVREMRRQNGDNW